MPLPSSCRIKLGDEGTKQQVVDTPCTCGRDRLVAVDWSALMTPMIAVSYRYCRWFLVAAVTAPCVGVTTGILARASSTRSNPEHYSDRSGDAVARPTDLGPSAPFDPAAHRLIDMAEINIGAWAPDSPVTDLFAGSWGSSGEFLRLDLTVNGLVNPPGSAEPLSFDPFAHGDHPVYGFVEIDMDGHVHTGGELDAPQFRYLGNAARFGGKPSREGFIDRVALDGSAFDQDVTTAPYVERHGEEFHLALLGNLVDDAAITEISGDGDLMFEEDEVWHLEGRFFHRAHGFEPFSLASGGHHPGDYSPTCVLEFSHDTGADETRISLVFPLTNEGAGLARGEPPEPMNSDPSDHASVFEALIELQTSALFLTIFPTGLPEEAIIWSWADQDPDEYLEPSGWELTALTGTSYTAPASVGLRFVWTDVFPDVLLGDVDGNGQRDGNDTDLIESFVLDQDGSDGVFDNQVMLLDFADGFTVFDVNYDGVVDALDSGSMLTEALPVSGGSLWREGRNTIRLMFSWDVSAPLAGDVVIEPMLSGGLFGGDISAGFDIGVEDDSYDKPRVLKIVDVDPPDLVHRQWYAVRTTGNWAGGGDFVVEYVVQFGDANGDGTVLNLDTGLINAGIPNLSVGDQDRRDIDGDGTVLNDDVSTANVYIPSFRVPKPNGH